MSGSVTVDPVSAAFSLDAGAQTVLSDIVVDTPAQIVAETGAIGVVVISPAALDITEDDVCAALRSFLIEILPYDIDIIRGQQNRIPEPSLPNYIIFMPTSRPRLATNINTYNDPFAQGTTGPGVQNILQKAQMSVQIDLYGPNSGNYSTIVATLFRDAYGTYAIGQYSGGKVAPLYCDEPKQMAFTDGEDQYEDRWVIAAELQVNSTVTVPQQFADQLVAKLRSVPAVYPVS